MNHFLSKHSPKIIKHGESYIGIAGHPLLVDIFLDQQPNQDLIKFLYNLHQTLAEEFFLLNPQNISQPFQATPFELLSISPNGIFEVNFQCSIREYSRFTAIGTGEEYALWRHASTLQHPLTAEELAIKGVESAAKFDRKIALPAVSQIVNVTLNEHRRLDIV